MKRSNAFFRRYLFEFEDLSWFPDIIRSGGTDYLRYFLNWTKLYQPTIPLLKKALELNAETKLIDLCSGGGGYIDEVMLYLNKDDEAKYTVLLTDKFPNIQAFEWMKKQGKGSIGYAATAIDVMQVPHNLKGFRVLYSAIHHFKPEQVQHIVVDAVKAKAPIAIFDGDAQFFRPLQIMALLLVHPIAFLLATPFFKPVTFSRFVFTYLIPLIPLYTIWDGAVSILRMYTAEELRQLATEIDNNYQWEYGQTKNALSLRATYLIGYPKHEN